MTTDNVDFSLKCGMVGRWLYTFHCHRGLLVQYPEFMARGFFFNCKISLLTFPVQYKEEGGAGGAGHGGQSFDAEKEDT